MIDVHMAEALITTLAVTTQQVTNNLELQLKAPDLSKGGVLAGAGEGQTYLDNKKKNQYFARVWLA